MPTPSDGIPVEPGVVMDRTLGEPGGAEDYTGDPEDEQTLVNDYEEVDDGA